MLQEAIVKLKELVGLNTHLRHDALGFDGYSEHVLSDTFEVNHEHHIVDMLHTWDKLDHDLSCAILSQPSTIILDVEFVLEGTTITRDSNHVVDVDL